MDVPHEPPAPSQEEWLASPLPGMPEAEHALFAAFAREIQDAVQLGGGAPFCSPRGLRELFDFFLPDPGLAPHGVKLEASASPAGDPDHGACYAGGSRILVHAPDTPFLPEILRQYFARRHLTIFLHMRFSLAVSRDRQGVVRHLGAGPRELFLVFLVEGRHDETLKDELTALLVLVKQSVDDFPAMRQSLLREAKRLGARGEGESARLLVWLVEDHFVFMGMARVGADGVLDASAGLGLFRGGGAAVRMDRMMPGTREEIRTLLPGLLALAQPVALEFCHQGQYVLHAPDGLDLALVQQEEGGALLLLGRFSRTALATHAAQAPGLAAKLDRAMALLGHPPGSYLHQESKSLLTRLPLRELLHAQPRELAAWVGEILAIQGERDPRVLWRQAGLGHYLVLATVLAASRYRAGVEIRLAAAFSRHLGLPVVSSHLAESGAFFLILCHAPATPGLAPPDVAALALLAREEILTWEDRLAETLLQFHPPARAAALFHRFAGFFPALYQEAVLPREAMADLPLLERLAAGETLVARVAEEGEPRVVLFSRRALELTGLVGIFSRFGLTCLEEFSTSWQSPAGPLSLHRFRMGGACAAGLADRSQLFCNTVEGILDHRIADDPLNRLLLSAALPGEMIRVLCGLRQYLAQLAPALSPALVDRVLLAHPELARLLTEAFRARFEPGLQDRGEAEARVVEAFQQKLARVDNLTEDRVLARLLGLVRAMVRSNAFFPAAPERALALKFAGEQTGDAPSPRPWREVFVLGLGLQGVHLRSGPVSRGGIRHSDRWEDFRAEIHALWRTQRVKNGLIVPEGAKGGFVLAPDFPGKPADGYVRFVSALLDVTDDAGGQGERDALHEPADPYLVVAADKGTATFSDLANTLAEQRRFWLGDAFASGGQSGYDHKKLGITARGAWECVRLHCAELGRDLDGLTVVGIGDMSGDVFGNGMLRSSRIRLLAAFDHRHLFLDPDPGVETAFRERERLFRLPRSSWRDYDPALISAGGGVFDRAAKAIPISARVRDWLGAGAGAPSGEELVRLLLQAPVDLLYNGGIGTYVKAGDESHGEVGDKANDAVRVNGARVRARMVAEGGNLGFTMRGRVEYALFGGPEGRGGRINSDAVDNSGGVDLSDREVNLKILFSLPGVAAQLGSRQARDRLLADLADEVAAEVLADNRAQHEALGRDETLFVEDADAYGEALLLLRQAAGLEPGENGLPDPAWLAAQGVAPPRPAAAVLLGQAKIFLKRVLLDSSLPGHSWRGVWLAACFPPTVRDRFAVEIGEHPLRRELIATHLSNRFLDRVGVGLFCRHLARLPFPPRQAAPLLVESWFLARHFLDVAVLEERLSRQAPSAARRRAERLLADTLFAVARHLARHAESREPVHVERGRKAWGRFWRRLLLADPPSSRWEALAPLREMLLADGMEASLVREVLLFGLGREAGGILALAREGEVAVEEAGMLHFLVSEAFSLTYLQESLRAIRVRDRWGRLTLEETRENLNGLGFRLGVAVLARSNLGEPGEVGLARFLEEKGEEVGLYRELVGEARARGLADLLPLTVLVKRLGELAAPGKPL